MPRRRMIDPDFWKDHCIADLSPEQRLFLIGCISNADDEGRLEGSPAYLKAAIFMYDEAITNEQSRDILSKCLKTMASWPKSHQYQILLYQNAKRDYLYFPNWYEQQKPSHPTKSKLPSPDIRENLTNSSRDTPEPITKTSRNSPEGFASSSALVKVSIVKDSIGEVSVGKVSIGGGRGGETTATANHLETEIFNKLISCFRYEWGRVPADDLSHVIPREPDSRETAQIRDVAKEIAAAGGCRLEIIDEVFRDAAQREGKRSVSYARAILLDRLGIPRDKSP